MPAINTMAPQITNGKTGLTESNMAMAGEDKDPTLAPADAVPKAVVLKIVGDNSQYNRGTYNKKEQLLTMYYCDRTKLTFV